MNFKFDTSLQNAHAPMNPANELSLLKGACSTAKDVDNNTIQKLQFTKFIADGLY